MTLALTSTINEDQTVAQLHDLRMWVRTAPAEEAHDAATRAREAREWARIRKMAARIALEASRLEAEALRRLGQLGALGGLHSHYKAAARYFATLDEPAFTEMVEGMREGETPLSNTSGDPIPGKDRRSGGSPR